MAETQSTTPTTEAGLAFRAEMYATSLVLGYWKYGLGAVGVILAGFFVYGQYSNYRDGVERKIAGQVSDAESAFEDDLTAKLDDNTKKLLVEEGYSLGPILSRVQQVEELDRRNGTNETDKYLEARPALKRVVLEIVQLEPESQQALYQMSTPVDTVLRFAGDLDDDGKAKVEKAADQLLAIGGSDSGMESCTALLEAADLYRHVGKADKRRAALEAVEKKGKGPALFAAEMNLADLDLSTGKADDGIKRLKDVVAKFDGFYAQEADAQLGVALEYNDRKDEAKQVYDDFLKKWPESPRKQDIQDRSDRLAKAAPAPTTPPAGG